MSQFYHDIKHTWENMIQMCLNLGMHSSRREKHINDKNIFHLDVWRIKLISTKHDFINLSLFIKALFFS